MMPRKQRIRLVLIGFVCAQALIIAAGLGLMLAAILHASAFGIALTTLGIALVLLAARYSSARFATQRTSLLVIILGLVGSILPVVAVLCAPVPWMLAGLAGYAFLALETLVFSTAMRHIERARDETGSREDEPDP